MPYRKPLRSLARPDEVRRTSFLAGVLGIAAVAAGCAGGPAERPMASGATTTATASGDRAGAIDGMSGAPTPQMKRVLDQLQAMGVKPIDTLTVEQARSQPTPADAVKAVLRSEGRSTEPTPVGRVEDRTIVGPAGAIPIRIYWPQTAGGASGAAGATGSAGSVGQTPIILYIHGGGWVIANLDVYDASPRALVDATGAIVVSTHYRLAPEHRFPAAHDDTWTAWRWTLANAAALGADPAAAAVVGESAGGNMAAAIALRARDEGVQQPVHQVLVYPVADAAVGTTASERNNRKAAPLNTGALPWFYQKYLSREADRDNPYFSIIEADLRGVAPATVITAQIDPLRSEGVDYAQRLRAAGVRVDERTYDGVTHEFFGMGAVLEEARDAVRFAASGLQRDLSAAARGATPRARAAGSTARTRG